MSVTLESAAIPIKWCRKRFNGFNGSCVRFLAIIVIEKCLSAILSILPHSMLPRILPELQ
jgi:hypothetical protein